jgi:hypothetical protein
LERVETPDKEIEWPKAIAIGLTALRKEFRNLATMIEDHSRPVDEYRPQTLIADVESTITIQPQWEVPEIIKSVLITGPTGNVTLQLGMRVWVLTIPATGFIVISPLWLVLDRTDQRILTASVAGQYTLELMGHADTRGNLV